MESAYTARYREFESHTLRGQHFLAHLDFHLNLGYFKDSMFGPEQKFEEGFEEGKEKTPQLKPITQEEFEKALNKEKEEMGSMRELIIQAIEESLALDGSHMIKIKFKPEAINAAHHFLEMASSKIIKINNNDKRILGDVVEHGNWRGGNRTITLTLADKFDEKLFIKQLENVIEKIEAID